MNSKLKRAPGLYLTGFMGSGKTTIAQLLADRLGWDFVDLDAEIEGAQKDTIAHIFESKGEPEFRRIENEVLKIVVRKVERGMPAVVALGGGTFVQSANYALLEDHGISIWLDCPFESIVARIEDTSSRPLARDKDAFRRLYDDRRAGYGQAHFRVDADCAVEQAVELIMQLPIWK
jgi:shikimate kinase